MMEEAPDIIRKLVKSIDMATPQEIAQIMQMTDELWTTYELFQSTWRRVETLVSRIEARVNGWK